MARVSAGARLHFGFCNLSLSHERLYGAPSGSGSRNLASSSTRSQIRR